MERENAYRQDRERSQSGGTGVWVGSRCLSGGGCGGSGAPRHRMGKAGEGGAEGLLSLVCAGVTGFSTRRHIAPALSGLCAAMRLGILIHVAQREN